MDPRIWVTSRHKLAKFIVFALLTASPLTNHFFTILKPNYIKKIKIQKEKKNGKKNNLPSLVVNLWTSVPFTFKITSPASTWKIVFKNKNNNKKKTLNKSEFDKENINSVDIARLNWLKTAIIYVNFTKSTKKIVLSNLKN